ncbi:MAG: transcription antitermination factor NusB [Atopobiaceae bacterium]|nr:transcription antitermination factor NusB [Atopobiaceae bacterium]MCI2173405.1 transcription antitermination factor NusB [Atopobiaceae bacterium]MCI2207400.1 transcription antitermination factor NusB [Atopobiaceae bacterium]
MSDSRLTGRTLARSQALQILFQAEACGRSVDDVLAGDFVISQGPLDPFAEMLARGTGAMIPTLDAVIASVSENWGVERMASVDRNLLRLSVFEMLHVSEVATAVTISESVILAKAYGTDESSRFVNGILGRVARDLDAGVDVEAVALERQLQERIAAEEAAKEAEAAEKAEREAADKASAEVEARYKAGLAGEGGSEDGQE